MEFEWDDDKNDSNIDKHGVSFEEARDIWRRPDELLIEEDDRGYDEDRYLAWGVLSDGTLLVVALTFRAERIRVISARYAGPKERKHYYEKIHRS